MYACMERVRMVLDLIMQCDSLCMHCCISTAVVTRLEQCWSASAHSCLYLFGSVVSMLLVCRKIGLNNDDVLCTAMPMKNEFSHLNMRGNWRRGRMKERNERKKKWTHANNKRYWNTQHTPGKKTKKKQHTPSPIWLVYAEP